MLQEFERQGIAEALSIWIDGHPDPDDPAFRIAQASEPLTPRQIYISVLENDPLGQQIMALLEYSVRRSSLEDVARELAYFETEPPPAAAASQPVDA